MVLHGDGSGNSVSDQFRRRFKGLNLAKCLTDAAL